MLFREGFAQTVLVLGMQAFRNLQAEPPAMAFGEAISTICFCYVTEQAKVILSSLFHILLSIKYILIVCIDIVDVG